MGRSGQHRVQSLRPPDIGAGMACSLHIGHCQYDLSRRKRRKGRRRRTRITRLCQGRKRPPRARTGREMDPTAQTLYGSHPAARHGDGRQTGRQRRVARRAERKRHRTPVHTCRHHRDIVQTQLHPQRTQKPDCHLHGRGTDTNHPRRIIEVGRTDRHLGKETQRDRKTHIQRSAILGGVEANGTRDCGKRIGRHQQPTHHHRANGC